MFLSMISRFSNDSNIYIFKQPAGRMKSRFIIDIAKSALSLTKGSVTDFGRHPEGLFTLIAVAVSTFQHSFNCNSIFVCSLNVV